MEVLALRVCVRSWWVFEPEDSVMPPTTMSQNGSLWRIRCTREKTARKPRPPGYELESICAATASGPRERCRLHDMHCEPQHGAR